MKFYERILGSSPVNVMAAKGSQFTQSMRFCKGSPLNLGVQSNFIKTSFLLTSTLFQPSSAASSGVSRTGGRDATASTWSVVSASSHATPDMTSLDPSALCVLNPLSGTPFGPRQRPHVKVGRTRDAFSRKAA